MDLLQGSVLRPDEEANHNVYGDRASARTLLASSGLSAPTQATPFLRALGPGSRNDARCGERSGFRKLACEPAAAGCLLRAGVKTDADLRRR